MFDDRERTDAKPSKAILPQTADSKMALLRDEARDGKGPTDAGEISTLYNPSLVSF